MSQARTLAAAAAAAALLSVGSLLTSVVAAEAPVKCAGINSCKGQSKCKTADSACAGQNSCKGKGWLPVPSAKECTDKGGTVISG